MLCFKVILPSPREATSVAISSGHFPCLKSVENIKNYFTQGAMQLEHPLIV